MTRRQTMELTHGDVVATRMVMASHGFVTSAAPGARGVWRTVDDVTIQPVDTKAENDRLIFFTDGTKAATKTTSWWGVQE